MRPDGAFVSPPRMHRITMKPEPFAPMNAGKSANGAT